MGSVFLRRKTHPFTTMYSAPPGLTSPITAEIQSRAERANSSFFPKLRMDEMGWIVGDLWGKRGDCAWKKVGVVISGKKWAGFQYGQLVRAVTNRVAGTHVWGPPPSLPLKSNLPPPGQMLQCRPAVKQRCASIDFYIAETSCPFFPDS